MICVHLINWIGARNCQNKYSCVRTLHARRENRFAFADTFARESHLCRRCAPTHARRLLRAMFPCIGASTSRTIISVTQFDERREGLFMWTIGSWIGTFMNIHQAIPIRAAYSVLYSSIRITEILEYKLFRSTLSKRVRIQSDRTRHLSRHFRKTLHSSGAIKYLPKQNNLFVWQYRKYFVVTRAESFCNYKWRAHTHAHCSTALSNTFEQPFFSLSVHENNNIHISYVRNQFYWSIS